jgi:hypothetical protein
MAGDCAAECAAQRQLPVCQTEFAALMACAATTPVMCNSSGKASIQGCANEGLAYLGCLAGGFDAGVRD